MDSSDRSLRRKPGGFTLIELLVVVGIIAVLISILVPSLSQARKQARTAKCLANIRGMEIAHWMYMTENNGLFIQVGLSHGGHTGIDASAGWIVTLQQYYSNALLYRCPEDVSIYWPLSQGGTGASVSGVYRSTSFGINDYLDRNMNGYTKLSQVTGPQNIVHFLEMAEEGEFAVADHPHVENWKTPAPTYAASELEINQHGGPAAAWNSVTNWGFLDGHAETLPFKNVYRNINRNSFNPALFSQ